MLSIGRVMSRPVRLILADLVKFGADKTLERACHRHGVTASSVLGFRVREASVARARREFLCLFVDTLGLSQPEAARFFGVDHTTIGWHLRARQRELAAT
jgi:hypothetical protein